MTGRELSVALRGNGPVFGTLVTSPSPHFPAAIAGSGLDFVFIDTEHIALDRETVSWMCQAYSLLNLAPIVRIPEPNPNLAAMVLDGGAKGVIAPYVESADQVRALAGAVKSRPLKGQRLERHLNGEPLEPVLNQYLNDRCSENVLIINVESVPAVNALDELLGVPGLDGVLVGPHDLSCSLGIPEQYHHPRFESAVREIIGKARDREIGAGIHFWSDIEQEKEWLKCGLNMLIHSADITLFSKHLQLELDEIRDSIHGCLGRSAPRSTVNI